MILVAPQGLFDTYFRKQESFTDENGQQQTRTVRVATGRKLEDGTVLASAVTSFGEPVRERGGVTNPRIAFSHPWSEEEVAWMRDVLIPAIPGPSPRNQVLLVDALPTDWRYPTEGVA